MDEWAREIADQCLAVRVRRLNRRITRIFDEELRAVGLTTPQLNLLVAISRLDHPGAAELCRVLDLEKSTASRNLARMEALGWIVRSDGIGLTRRGQGMIRRAHPCWKKAQERVVDAIGGKARTALDAMQRKLKDLT